MAVRADELAVTRSRPGVLGRLRVWLDREPVLGPAQVPQPGVGVPERRVATLPARPEARQMSVRSPTAAR